MVARLVRNEKVGGSNPPSSTTGRHPMRMSVFCMPGVVLRCLLLWCFVAAGVPGVGCAFCAGLLGVPVGGGLPAFVDCCPDRSPAAARPARPLAVRAASFARRVGSKPGQTPPPPTGTAARPRHRPRAPQPGPVAAHRYGRALRTLRRFPHQWRSRNSRLSLLLAAPLVFQAPSGPAAREARASLRSAPRLEARPCPPGPPAPSTPAALGR